MKIEKLQTSSIQNHSQFYNITLLKLQKLTGEKPIDIKTGEELDYGV